MMRFTTLLFSGMVAVSLSGCLDRGGLDPDDDGGSGGTTDAGIGTGGSGTGTGGSTGTGTGGRASTGGSPGTGTGGRASTGGSTGTGGKVMCGPVCDIYCPYGNVVDGNGCPTCRCNAGPVCPAIGCGTACPNGYVKDAKGCDTCTCNPDPKACTIEECGPMPTRTTIVICATTSGSGSGSGSNPGAGAGAVPPPADAPAWIAPFICQRNTDGKCAWYSGGCRICPTIACTLACTNGFQIGADGCQICACNPPPTARLCATNGDYMSCIANASCTWLAPGCGDPALAAAGCYQTSSLGCTSDAQCGTGHQCLKRVVDPCFNKQCAACAVVQTICQ